MLFDFLAGSDHAIFRRKDLLVKFYSVSLNSVSAKELLKKIPSLQSMYQKIINCKVTLKGSLAEKTKDRLVTCPWETKQTLEIETVSKHSTMWTSNVVTAKIGSPDFLAKSLVIPTKYSKFQLIAHKFKLEFCIYGWNYQ